MRSQALMGSLRHVHRPAGRLRGFAPFVFALATALVLTACGEAQWTAMVYPDRENLHDFDRIGVFEGLDQCRAAATEAIGLLTGAANVVPGWECGRNCSVDDDGDLRCDKYEQG